MKIKFRIPVVCQNGHKAFWYGELKEDSLAGMIISGVPEKYKCKCPKWSIGQGYKKNGDIQLWIGINDKDDIPIYDGDWLECRFEGQINHSSLVVYHGDQGYPAFDLKDNDMDCNALSYYNGCGTIKITGSEYLDGKRENHGGA